MDFDLIATATFGLESVVADEVKKLGYEGVKIENGKVTYRADALGICRSNLWLRTADRVRLKVGEFHVETFDNLFEQTKALPWEQYLPEDANFPVDGKSIKSKLFSVSDCQALVKKAIVERLKQKYQVNWFEETGPRYTIEVALLNDIATLTIDTSGPGLHKRGYRLHAVGAPIKETLAAALIYLSKWYPDTPLVDPCCGSGTIPIEAAMIGLNIAPGFKREFVSEQWPLIPEQLWYHARQETHDLVQFDRKLEIVGSDHDPRAVHAAKHNAIVAGVGDYTHFQVQSLTTLSSEREYGKIICNPPYGERLGEREQVENLYQEMGTVFSKMDTWSYYVITSHPGFERLFGTRASKKRKLYNGDVKVDYFQYFGPRPPRTFFRPDGDEDLKRRRTK
ncbi:MAG: putative N6-adenine-specific DNA methylase [Bacillota bacterium]|nr:MAG: putative N6-adenine-specific DNA methylase [Bacillota bacterium]